jgi:hypothetical protein
MLIFVSGHHPILGTQMLYFLDPILSARAALDPPTEFCTLEDSKTVPQLPLNRTRNVVSKPEIALPEEPLSPAEQHFVEECHAEKGEN